MGKQESDGGVSLGTGTSAILSIGKRDADADPALLYHGLPYLGYGYHYPAVAAVATGGPVPLLSEDTRLLPEREALSTRFPASCPPPPSPSRSPREESASPPELEPTSPTTVKRLKTEKIHWNNDMEHR